MDNKFHLTHRTVSMSSQNQKTKRHCINTPTSTAYLSICWQNLQPGHSPHDTQGVGHLARVRPRIIPRCLHDDEQLVVSGEKMAWGLLQGLSILQPLQLGPRAAWSHALQHWRLPHAGCFLLFHRTDEVRCFCQTKRNNNDHPPCGCCDMCRQCCLSILTQNYL